MKELEVMFAGKEVLGELFEALAGNAGDDTQSVASSSDSSDDSETDLDRENFRLSVDFVAKNLDVMTIMKAGASADMKTVDRQIKG